MCSHRFAIGIEKGAAPHRSFCIFDRSTKFDGNVLQKLIQSNQLNLFIYDKGRGHGMATIRKADYGSKRADVLDGKDHTIKIERNRLSSL